MRMINLSLNELKLIEKSRNIKDYKNKSENNLMKILSEPKPKINLSKNKKKRDQKRFQQIIDDIEYRGIREIGNTFNEVALNKVDKDY